MLYIRVSEISNQSIIQKPASTKHSPRTRNIAHRDLWGQDSTRRYYLIGETLMRILIFNKTEYEQMGIMTASKIFTKALYIHFPCR